MAEREARKVGRGRVQSSRRPSIKAIMVHGCYRLREREGEGVMMATKSIKEGGGCREGES